jgi:transitional endoplasmic reticulum ATPase
MPEACPKPPVDRDLSIEVLARSTQGFSGADIAEIVTSASKLAIREAILATEDRKAKIESGEIEDDGASNEIAGEDADWQESL